MKDKRFRSSLLGAGATNRFSDASLVEQIGITEPEIRKRKQWLQFGDEDVDRLRDINPVASEYADQVIDSLYEHFMSFPDTAAFFQDPETLTRVKALQKEYFFRLTEGEYDREYVENRLKIGAVHGRIGLDPKWYLGAYAHYMRSAGQGLFKAYKTQPQKFFELYSSLSKIVFFDIGLAIDTFIFSRERTIREQKERIQDLATPVLQLREGLLLLPIRGRLDALRAQQITEELLHEVRLRKANASVIDFAGVVELEGPVANQILETVDAARLMGAQVILTGLAPEIAQSLAQSGVDMSRVVTATTLGEGIELAEEYLGYRTVQIPQLRRFPDDASYETEGSND